MLAGLAWRRRARPEARSFIFLMAAVAIWALPEGLLQLSDNESLWMLWTKVEYLGIAAVPLAWFLTALQYGGRVKAVPRPIWVVLVAVPLITVALAWTDWALLLAFSAPILMIDELYKWRLRLRGRSGTAA